MMLPVILGLGLRARNLDLASDSAVTDWGGIAGVSD